MLLQKLGVLKSSSEERHKFFRIVLRVCSDKYISRFLRTRHQCEGMKLSNNPSSDSL